MAPPTESAYFPSLGAVLGGHDYLVSWEIAYVGLSKSIYSSQQDSKLEQFLSDQVSISLLSDLFNAFRSPTAQSRSALDTKTAAINVTPDCKGVYDLKEIKDDCLWLSKQCSISELISLRVVVLEWQSRPSAHLLSTPAPESVTGDASFGSSILGGTSKQIGNDFNSPTSRRIRILNLYLSERIFLLKTSGFLLQKGFSQQESESKSKNAALDGGERRENLAMTWVARVGNTILNARALNGNENLAGSRSIVQDGIKALRARIANLESGSGLFKDEGGFEESEKIWSRCQLLEIIHIMQIMFDMVTFSRTIPSTSTILSWLHFAKDYGFFEGFETPFPQHNHLIYPIQSLLCVITLSLLKLSLSINLIHSSQDAHPPAEKSSIPYIADATNVTEIHEMFIDATESGARMLGPAILGWCVMAQNLREMVLSQKEVRELQQSAQAVSGFKSLQGSGNVIAVSPTESPTTAQKNLERQNALAEKIPFENTLEAILGPQSKTDPIEYMARTVMEHFQVFEIITGLSTTYCKAFTSSEDLDSSNQIRIVLLDLMRPTLQMVEYFPEVVQACLAILSEGNSGIANTNQTCQNNTLQPANIFLNDKALMGMLFKPAISRFPYEIIPFLRLMRALSTSLDVSDSEGTIKATSILDQMKTFSQVLPEGFRGYRATDEARDANFVELLETLPIFSERATRRQVTSSLRPGNNTELSSKNRESNEIQARSIGRIVSEDKPIVALWYHEYSGLRYIGQLLSTALSGSRLVDHATTLPVDRYASAEIIGLLVDLIKSTTSASENEKGITAANRILEEASDGLDRNQDIISVVFDLTEEELGNHEPKADPHGTTDLLSNCMDFIGTVIRILPGRVWPYLARSCLLDLNSQGGKLISVVSGSELPTGQFPFLLACMRVYKSLVEDAAIHSVARRAFRTSKKRHVRFEGIGTGVPDTVMGKVLQSFGKIVVDVLQSSGNWNFASTEERMVIRTVILRSFQTILYYSYSIEDSADSSNQVIGVLEPSAKTLLESFLLMNSITLIDSSILNTLRAAVVTPVTTIYLRMFSVWTTEVEATLEFIVLLLRARIMLGRPSSDLEENLLRHSALFTRLYVAYPTYRRPILTLLRTLTAGAIQSSSEEPTSLLSHIGISTAESFLSILVQLDGVLKDDEVYTETWQLLSSAISNRQQWLSVFILTGRAPRDSLKHLDESNSTLTKSSSKSMLQVALDNLVELENLPRNKLLSIFDFFCRAEDALPWIMLDIHKNARIFDSLAKYVEKLAASIKTQNDKDSVRLCEDIRLLAYSTEILAMHVYRLRQDGSTSFAKSLIQSLRNLSAFCLGVPGYNGSLSANLKKNFAMKYPGCTISSFQNTQLQSRKLGEGFFYNISLAEKVLSFEPSWHGKNGKDGLAAEVRRANLNLSKVEAQIILFHSWKILSIELTCILDDPDAQSFLTEVTKLSLASNARSNLPENVFEQLTQSRADLAFTLMQRFSETKMSSSAQRSMLSIIWSNFRAIETSLDLALSGAGAQYVRTLLKTLLLSVQAHRGPSVNDSAKKTSKRVFTSNFTAMIEPASPVVLQTIMDILTNLVASGFRAVAASIHESPSETSPGDLVLLNALLQECLHVPGIETYYGSIASHFADASTLRVAATLYSWSDRLTFKGDPVYGELSMQILLTMSSVPLIAEQIAVDGILAQISAARLTTRMKSGLRPLEANNQRLYSIWARGLLPFCLNLLAAAGPGIAAEITAFIESFVGHLQLASSFFSSNTSDDGANSISLTMASEAHSLALLTAVLDRYRVAGQSLGLNSGDIPEISWNRIGIRGALDALLSGSRARLRDRIISTTLRETELASQKGERRGSESRLEDFILQELEACESILSIDTL